MTEIVDYGTLKTSLGSVSHRSDLVSEYGGFISLALSTINSELRCRQMEKTATINSSTKDFTLPADFLEMRSIYKGTRELQSLISPNQRNDCDWSREPAYSIRGSTLELRPEPTTSTDLEITYYARLAMFVSDTDTNTVLTTYPTLYLDGAMERLKLHIVDSDGEINKWASRLMNQITQINSESEKA